MYLFALETEMIISSNYRYRQKICGRSEAGSNSGYENNIYRYYTIESDMLLCYSSLEQCIRLDIPLSPSQHRFHILRDANDCLREEEEYNAHTT